MNWEAIGATGEVLGAITVVATLFYLSRQIRQNSVALTRSNDYARANAIHQTNAHFGQVFVELARDAELASIYHRALAGEVLDTTETVRFQAFVNTVLAWMEDLFVQTESELGFSEVQERGTDFMVLFRPYLSRLLETEAGRVWWQGDALALYSPSFRAAVDETLRS